MWNLFALDYKNEHALFKFGQTIVNSDANKLNELDIANTLRAYAHFQHVDYECIEVLLKQTIRRAQDFKLQSLAVIANSLADLDIVNPTFLEIVKQILIEKIDVKTDESIPESENMMPGKPGPKMLAPIDCAMFMTAFTRCKQFDSIDLLKSLEASFLSRIESANGPTLVTVFNSHANWCQHIVKESEVKPQPAKAYKNFQK